MWAPAGLTTQRVRWCASISCSQPVSTPTPYQRVHVAIILLGFTYILAVRPSATSSQSMRTKPCRNHWSLWLQSWADWRAFREDGQAGELRTPRQKLKKTHRLESQKATRRARTTLKLGPCVHMWFQKIIILWALKFNKHELTLGSSGTCHRPRKCIPKTAQLGRSAKALCICAVH